MEAPDTRNLEQRSIRDLVRAAIRMRPDRIVVGEDRWETAHKLLENLSGPDGTFFTIHANDPVSSDPVP